MRRRRALSSEACKLEGVRSSVLIEPASCSSISSSSEDKSEESEPRASSAPSRGGVGRKYVVEGGLSKFSSDTVIEASRVLNA